MAKLLRTKQNGRAVADLVCMLALAAWSSPLAAAEQGSDPFRVHMQPMLTTDDEWRTPNPDYEPGQRRPREYALQLRMQPDGRPHSAN